MAAGIELYNDVLNQKGSPALYSDIFANRPAFGYTGRLFISTDTNEIYRDTGTSWVLISGSGTSVNIYNSNGSLTAARTMTMAGFNLTFEGAASASDLIISANAGVNRDLSFATAGVARWDNRVTDAETGSNAGANYYLKAYNDAGTFLRNVMTITRSTGEIFLQEDDTLSAATDSVTGVWNQTTGTFTLSGTYTGGNPQGSQFNLFIYQPQASYTHAAAQYVGSQSNILRLNPNASLTVTMAQASGGVRTLSPSQNQIQFNVPAASTLTVDYASSLTLVGIYDTQLGAAGNLSVTNAYGLVINSLSEYGYSTLSMTNRWGIYQGGLNDTNYFNGTTLIGTTTNNGSKLQVSGSIYNTGNALLCQNSGSVLIGTTVNNAKLFVQVIDDANSEIARFDRINSALTDASRIQFFADPVNNTVTIKGSGTNAASIIFESGNNEAVRFTTDRNVGISQSTFGTSATRTLAISTGNSPASSPVDCFQLYSADITAGNAAAHFRTENGGIIKVYQETTAVGSATVSSPGAGSTIKTDDTFDGYTLQQVVKALRNQGLLA